MGSWDGGGSQSFNLSHMKKVVWQLLITGVFVLISRPPTLCGSIKSAEWHFRKLSWGLNLMCWPAGSCFGTPPPWNFVLSTLLLLKCSCQPLSLGVAVLDLPYLRGTVNLLPFFLPLLGSFLLGRCSLEAQHKHQEDDGNFLHDHSGAVVGPARG